MSRNSDPSHSEPKLIGSIPSKVFLLGEYAVLHGAPIWGAALPPRFELIETPKNWTQKDLSPGETWFSQLPSGSPAIRVLKSEASLKRDWIFRDPHQGRGGLGASTAQVALGVWSQCKLQNLPWDWKKTFELYRRVTAGEAFSPSGADLVIQMKGGVGRFDPQNIEFENEYTSLDWSQIWVFSATHQEGRKMATHFHLSQLEGHPVKDPNSSLIQELKAILKKADDGAASGEIESFGPLWTHYADLLAHAELESPKTRADRTEFLNIPGVWGAKGSGAYQSDLLVIGVRPEPEVQEEVMKVAKERNLVLVSQGLSKEPGIF